MMGEMRRKTKEVVKDKKIVSPKTFVAADIWNVFSYHSISKLPGMVWYGMVWYRRRSAEMPVASTEDLDDSLRMLFVNGTDSTMPPLPPSRAYLQPPLLICLGNCCCCCCYHYYGYCILYSLTLTPLPTRWMEELG